MGVERLSFAAARITLRGQNRRPFVSTWTDPTRT
jgi:hypothetical protein